MPRTKFLLAIGKFPGRSDLGTLLALKWGKHGVEDDHVEHKSMNKYGYIMIYMLKMIYEWFILLKMMYEYIYTYINTHYPTKCCFYDSMSEKKRLVSSTECNPENHVEAAKQCSAAFRSANGQRFPEFRSMFRCVQPLLVIQLWAVIHYPLVI